MQRHNATPLSARAEHRSPAPAAMAFAEGDIDNDGRFEPLAADMKPYGSGADIDAACGPVLPPDAYYTGRPGHTPMRSSRGTRAGVFRNRMAGVRGRRHRLELVGSVRRSGLRRRPRPVHGQRHVGEAFGYLPGAELLLTAWPVSRRASPLPMLSRSGSRSWKSLRRRSPGAAARPQCQAPSRAGREVPATRSDSSVIIATAEAPRAYPVNLIDEYYGTVLDVAGLPRADDVRSGSGRGVGAYGRSIRGGESHGHSRSDGRSGADAHGG